MMTKKLDIIQKQWIEQGIENSIKALQSLKEVYQSNESSLDEFQVLLNATKSVLNISIKNIEESFIQS